MTRAKDISKIVTDADLSGTLDVTGTVTAGGLKLGHQNYISWVDSGGTNRNAIQFDTDTLKIGISGNIDNTIIRSNGADRIKAHSNGDISFYEDTGTTPKLFWDASAESLTIGTATITPNGASDDLVIAKSGSTGLNFISGTSDAQTIAFGDTSDSLVGSLQYFHSDDHMEFTVNNAEAMRITSGGNVGIGTSSPQRPLHIAGTSNAFVRIQDTDNNADTDGLIGGLEIRGADGVNAGIFQFSSNVNRDIDIGNETSTGALDFRTNSTQRMRITSGGNVGIGITDPADKLQVANTSGSVSIALEANTTGASSIKLGDTANTAAGEVVYDNSNNSLAFKTAASERMRIESDGTLEFQAATDNVIKTNSNSSRIRIFGGSTASVGNGGALTLNGAFHSTGNYVDLASATSGFITFRTGTTERMRITSGGEVLIGKTTNSFSTAGSVFPPNGKASLTVNADECINCNRLTNDGNLIRFYQAGTEEGNISVSGSTVSYNGGHLSRWSRLLDNSKDTTIVKGTVMTNLDEMVEWGDEDNEQLNKMAVSSVEGDANVAGVFVNWDNDDDYNDMNIAMTGDMVIRIAQGTTVARGDLLMSAGDGTAKPQGDDIVRSKTIAKVTSTNVSHTYDDGTYLVPCVLMAC